jgi:hypothetical protein
MEEKPPSSDRAEETLRHRLTSLADAAPVAIFATWIANSPAG